jgi:co-chaperonin GroES (HSP10)
MKLDLRRNDILIKLPDYTGKLTRLSNNLELHTLTSQTYNPVSGVVFQKASCRHIEEGDTVYFQIFTYSIAVERAYGHVEEEHNTYKPYPYYAFKEGENWYMILREEDIYFILRGKQIIPLNGYSIASPVKLTYNTTFEIANLSGKMYHPNTATIVASNEFKYGDYVKTLRHCDITVEEKLNSPLLPEEYFIIESKNIICTMSHPPRASKGRVIIKSEPIDTESGGLINTETGKQKLLKGVVVSAGENTAWNEGETVLYARNSGMPYEDMLILEDKDIFAAIKP